MPRDLPSVEYLHKILFYDPDTGKLYWRHRTPDTFPALGKKSSEDIASNWNARWAGKPAFTQKDGSGYHHGFINNTPCSAAHVVWAMTYGVWPSETGFVLDHVDNDRANNRIENLRLVTLSQNARKRVPTSSNPSGVIGVTFDKSKGKWVARITVEGQRRLTIGAFKSFEDAVKARQESEKRFSYGRWS